MTFTTLQYDGVEKCLADWQISSCQREVSNQAHDRVALDMMLAADAADSIPYGGQIIFRIGRTPAAGTGVNAAGLPVSGITSWTGGTTFFVGWRVDNFRTGSPALEKMDLKFAGPWEFFFERLVFQKLWFTWNGTENVADWRSQIVLGQSVNALVGPADTIPGTDANNLMSVRQQLAEIIAYVVAQTTTDYGSPQLQSDALTSAIDGTDWDLYETPGANIFIPDYIPGYAVSGKTSAQSGANAANMQTVLRAPLEAVNDITCAEAMRKQLKWIGPMGDAVVWFDYTTTPPTLHVSTRDQLPSLTVPFVSSSSAGIKIKKRDDLIPSAIALKFRVTSTSDGTAYTQVINDIAGTISGTAYEGIGLTGALYTAASFAGGSPAYVGGSANSALMQALQNLGRDFGNVTTTIDMQGSSANSARCLIGTIAVDTSDFSAGGFWQRVFPDFATMTTAPSIVSGSTVSVTVDNPGNANPNQPDDGTAVDLDTYAYLLTDGQIAPWMLVNNLPGGAVATALQATINAKFVISENTVVGSDNIQLKHAPYKEKTARVTLVSIPGGLYETLASFIGGEVIPYGLAGFIYNIAQIPQYEGSFTIQETEVTDQCPMGNNLNLSGGRAEWSTMAACVQSISYDLTAGKTTLSFGPAGHLGAKDMVERLRSNRALIRPYYGIGGNVTNNANSQSGVQLGNNVAQRGPSPGAENHDQHVFPSSLSDMGANASTYQTAGSGIGPPGVTVDTRASGQPNYGGSGSLSAPNSPTVFLARGSGGTLSAWLRLSAADLANGCTASLAGLPGSAAVSFQAVQVCVDVGGVPTQKTMYMWGTPPS